MTRKDDFVDEILRELNELASDLLKDSEAIDGYLKKGTEGAVKALEQIKALLNRLCKALTKIHKLLTGSPKRSPLEELVRRVGASQHSDTPAKLKRFLREHRTSIQRLGVSPAIVNRLIDALEEEVDGIGPNGLANPQTLESASVLGTIREFRDLVCKIAQSPNLDALIKAPGMLRAVVTGVGGTALIVVDVTGAAMVAPHDWTGWTLVKAVKSVWAGVTMVRKAIKTLNEIWDSINPGPTAAERRARMRVEYPPPPKLK